MKVSIAQINSKLGDFENNKEKIRIAIKRALAEEANLLLLPFGVISGFPQENLMISQDFREKTISCLEELALETLNTNLSVFSEGREILAHGKIHAIESSEHKHLPLPPMFNKKDIDIFVNLGPKIFEKNQSEAYEIELRILASEKKAWIFDVNLAGASDEIIFTGLSSIINPNGEIIARLNFGEEDFLTVELETPEKYNIAPIPAGEEILYKAITIGIQNYFQKNNFKKILVSVSGGIDSALVLALAVEAVGSENVSALFLPSRFSSELSREEAQKLCNNLSVNLREISIEKFHQLFIEELEFINNGNPVWKENIQARIRGSIVMSTANAEGALVLATGNKTECAVGYCTLYGDTCGGLAPISDLLKTEVRSLCRFINIKYNKEIIPEKTISRPPSAELKENQQDSDSLPNYEFLDQVLFLHCEEGLDYHQIIKRLGRVEDVDRIFTLLYRSQYKRKQMAPGLKVSKRYFGLDWRIPSTVSLWFKDY